MTRALLAPHEPQALGMLLERLLAIADDAVVVVDERHAIVVFNEGAERIFGHRAAQVVGQPLDLLLPEAARATHSSHMATFAQSGRASRRMESRRGIQGRRRDGGMFDAEASISRLSIGEAVYFAAILRDVSQARRASDALARSETRFRRLAAMAPVGIFQADAQGGLTYVNERWCAITAIGAERALGDAWLSAVHPEDWHRVQRAWGAAVTGHQPFEQRFRFSRADDSVAWVLAQATPNLEPGADGGQIGTLTDITDNLRQAVSLERAKAEAEQAMRAKSLFLANMSHEIRTPLNAVLGMASLLLDTAMSDDQRDLVRTIRAGSEALQQVIDDILDFSKADAGKLEIEHQAFDLRRCIEEAVDMVAARAQDKGLNLAYLIEDGTPEALLGDALRLRQILVNLLSNAVKFTLKGEVFVAAESVRRADGGLLLRLAVHDSGIGISPEHLPKLFDSFTQVDPSTTRKYGGTGLGLAISKRLAELMGGELGVHSESGKGSVFQLCVPMTAADAPVPEPEFLHRDVPLLLGKRVLIVDDNLTNRRILTRLALRWGMRPSTLASPLEALDRIRHGEPFDLALLDMQMADGDGLELAEQIRKRYERESFPIVMLTSLGRTLPAAARGQVSACLSKPIKPGDLFQVCVRVLRGQAAAGWVPTPAPRPQPAMPLRPMRVLLAEDNLINQRVALRMLGRLGLQADVVANGLEVLDSVERQPYDLVLMDIQMPGMDGLQASHWIIQRRGATGLPRIIAMTANAMPGDRERLLGAGIDAYLPKPIDPDALAGVLRQVFELVDASKDQAGIVQSPAVADEPVVDIRRLEHLRTMQEPGQPPLVAELIDLFLVDAAGHVQLITQACIDRQWPLLRGAVHRFLSAAQNIGAARLSSLCEAIETFDAEDSCVDAAAPQDCARLVEQLVVEVGRVRQSLNDLRGRYA